MNAPKDLLARQLNRKQAIVKEKPVLHSLSGRYFQALVKTLRVLADARASARHVNLGTRRRIHVKGLSRGP